MLFGVGRVFFVVVIIGGCIVCLCVVWMGSENMIGFSKVVCVDLGFEIG